MLLVPFIVVSFCSKNGGTQSTNNKYWHVKYVASTPTTGDFTAIYNSKEPTP